MKSTSYIIVTHRNGKRKVYRTGKYLILRRIKLVGAIAAAILTVLLFCGMAVIENHPLMPVQIMFFSELGLSTLILIICLYIGNREPQKKQNKKSKGKKDV